MVTLSQWGLIPHWVKNEQQALLIRDKTLNARIETLETKPSFKDVSFKRGILFVDGFFEFKHEKVEKYLITCLMTMLLELAQS